MSNAFRKIRRNALKKYLGTNKIREFWHQQNDTLEQKLRKARKGEYSKGE